MTFYLRFQKLALFLAVLLAALPAKLFAQVEPPEREHLFQEDVRKDKKEKEKTIQKVLKEEKPPGEDVDFDAPNIEFLKGQNVVQGTGGVLISKGKGQLQADQAKMNVDTKDVEMKGKVFVNGPGGTVSAESGTFNLNSEVGDFEKANIALDDGAYSILADKAHKITDTKYKLLDTSMTTCHCTDGTVPWSIVSEKTNITQEGYANSYASKFKFYGVPLFYTPYMLFPTKIERSSGLLVPSYGYSHQNGFEFSQPIYMVLDDSTDLKFTPFYAANSRYGSFFDYRQQYSLQSSATARVLYSNEDMRGNELRGTDISPYSDPTIDTNRFAGYLNQQWRNKPGSYIPLSLVSNVHYVSDNLIPRELPDKLILDRSQRFATSAVALRGSLGEYVNTEVGAEYNQAIYDKQEAVFQRLPEFSVNASRSFHPFGYNDYGFRTVPAADVSMVSFHRDTGYEGLRTDFNPSLNIPFHVGNYFNSKAYVGTHYTVYDMGTTLIPGTDKNLDSSNSRNVFGLGYTMSTGVERVYDLDEDNWLTSLTSWGAKNQSTRLRRLKNTIEPTISYVYIPEVNQDDLPQFDALDRIRKKSQISYGLQTRLFGRFVPVNSSGQAIAELTPRVEDVPMLGTSEPLPELGGTDAFGAFTSPTALNRGGVRELMNFYVGQLYDFNEARRSGDNIQPFSNIGTRTNIFPTNYFAMTFQGNYSSENNNLPDWSFAGHLKDDRGDILRARYSFFHQQVNQVEGSAELALTEQWKLAYYARYDQRAKDFIEQRGALRFYNNCKCWHIDLGMSETINPDVRHVLLSLTFAGLGDVVQNVSLPGSN